MRKFTNESAILELCPAPKKITLSPLQIFFFNDELSVFWSDTGLIIATGPVYYKNTIRKRSIWSWCINARWKCELNGLTSRLVCPSGKNGGNAFWDCQICHFGNKKKTSNYAEFCICTKKCASVGFCLFYGAEGSRIQGFLSSKS